MLSSFMYRITTYMVSSTSLYYPWIRRRGNLSCSEKIKVMWSLPYMCQTMGWSLWAEAVKVSDLSWAWACSHELRKVILCRTWLLARCRPIQLQNSNAILAKSQLQKYIREFYSIYQSYDLWATMRTNI